MRQEQNRGTGATQRMLERVAADPSESVTVVAHNHSFAVELCSRFAGMVETEARTQEEVRTADGRVVRFVSMLDPQLPILLRPGSARHWDHHAWATFSGVPR